MCYVVGISPPSKVKKFLLLFCLRRGKGAEFLPCCVFCPRSGEGNSGLHSTQFNYSSFYGIGGGGGCRNLCAPLPPAALLIGQLLRETSAVWLPCQLEIVERAGGCYTLL